MPRIVDYPRGSLSNAVEIADAVYDLGGQCSIHTCADKMGKTVSGAFKALVSAADKFELISNQRGELTCTELFNQFRHAYSKEEEKALLQKAFLSSGVFKDLYDRFNGREVPTEILDRMLVREFEVPPQLASRISGYFIKGARDVGFLNSNNQLLKSEGEHNDRGTQPADTDIPPQSPNNTNQPNLKPSTPNSYSVHFVGPGLDTTIEVAEEYDLQIINAVLKKIKMEIGILEDDL